MNNFWKGILSENGSFSSKRLVTVITAGIFLMSCVTVITLLIFMFLSTTKTQSINIKALAELTELLRDIMYYEFMVVIGGLGYITAPQFASALSSSLTSLTRSRQKNMGFGYSDYGLGFGNDVPINLDIPKGEIKQDSDGQLIG